MGSILVIRSTIGEPYQLSNQRSLFETIVDPGVCRFALKVRNTVSNFASFELTTELSSSPDRTGSIMLGSPSRFGSGLRISSPQSRAILNYANFQAFQLKFLSAECGQWVTNLATRANLFLSLTSSSFCSSSRNQIPTSYATLFFFRHPWPFPDKYFPIFVSLIIEK